MKNSDTLTKISALCSVVGMPGTVLSFSQIVFPCYTKHFAIFSVLSMLGFLYQVVFVESKKQKNTPSSDEVSAILKEGNPDFRRYWKLEDQCARLDLKNKDGKYAVCVQSRSLVCVVPTSQFYSKITPTGRFEKVTSSHGTPTIKQDAGTNGVLVDLGRIFQPGERLYLELTYRFKDSFCAEKEFFKIRKDYQSSMDRVFITFPDARPAKGLSCYVILSDSFSHKVNFTGNTSYSYINKRPVFEVSTNTLAIGQELEIEWNW